MNRLIDALRHFSAKSTNEFVYEPYPHRHKINFDETSEKNGFTNVDLDQLGYHETWQFCLHEHLEDPRQQKQWRVHGILIDNVFHVVWLDPDHLLFPMNENARQLR